MDFSIRKLTASRLILSAKYLVTFISYECIRDDKEVKGDILHALQCCTSYSRLRLKRAFSAKISRLCKGCEQMTAIKPSLTYRWKYLAMAQPGPKSRTPGIPMRTSSTIKRRLCVRDAPPVTFASSTQLSMRTTRYDADKDPIPSQKSSSWPSFFQSSRLRYAAIKPG